MAMDGDVEKDFVAGSVAVNGQDLERSCRGQQEPAAAADGVSRGLAIGHFVRELMVEGVASFLLVFWSAVAALMQEMHGTLMFPMVCLVVALTVGFVLCWLGPVHFNPAVTVTFTVFGYLSWAKEGWPSELPPAPGLVIGPVSGGSMNPIRTLGPAIVFGRYTSVWIYLVAPVAGMLIGALCNRLVRGSDAILAYLCGTKPRAVAPRTTPRAVGALASPHY